MSICPCCGQEKRSAATSTVWLDAALIALCNEAYEAAVRQGASEVTVAHLAFALATDASSRAVFGRLGLVADDMAVAAEQQSAAAVSQDITRAPVVSSELRALLDRTQRVAQEHARAAADASDLLFALTHRCRDLAGVTRLDRARAAAAQIRRAGGRGQERSMPPQALNAARPSGMAGGPWHQETRRSDAGRTCRGLPPGPSSGREVGAQPSFDRPAAGPQSGYSVHRAHDGQPARGRSLAAADAGVAHPPAPAVASGLTPPADAHDLAALTARLNQQERLIAELCLRLVDADRATRTGARVPRPGRGEAGAMTRRGTAQSSARQRASGRDEADGTPNRLPAAATPAGAASTATDQGAAASRGRRYWRRTRRSAWLSRLRGEGRDAFATSATSWRSQAARPARKPALPVDAEDDDDILDAGGERPKRFYLALDDELARAPSIGPKTAARFAPHGVLRVRDLLNNEPELLAAAVGARHITKRRITEWIAQARLVCVIPWLRGTHAQLLVGAGFDTLGKIQSADPGALCAAILKFAASREGQSVLRAGPPPDIERIKRWVEHAHLAEPERAA